MKITDILASHRTTLSFEVFPPKTSDKLETVRAAALSIAGYKPDFMSVTYGAGGGTNNRFTSAIASEIISSTGVTAMAHLTCVGSDGDTVKSRIEEFRASGIENVLALRGDLPLDADPSVWKYRHASELAAELTENGFCVGGACYPEGHPESPSLDADIEFLKKKIDAGCGFLTTQMFFDNSIYYRFVDKVRAAGIDVPIVAGIMPIISAKQIKRSCELSGTVMPKVFLDIVDRYADDPESMTEAGIVYACAQIIDLLAHGVSNIHVYVMNKPDTAARIRHDLGHILPLHADK